MVDGCRSARIIRRITISVPQLIILLGAYYAAGMMWYDRPLVETPKQSFPCFGGFYPIYPLYSVCSELKNLSQTNSK